MGCGLTHEQTDERGQPRYAGLRYVSRLNPDWECWAIFQDRLADHHQPGMPVTIFPDNPDLLEVARLFGLTIECFPGSRQYLRPADPR